ncbi:RagB/SusD family nutrient uptake outer membrane protein [Sphingobacterium tabacisoli]|uniref:RagB/SusD family nutrient uptake outer membrane protein n=1 Tax=Sphingobacterium tabacisoli TaxID=2044855 RepID=A0ABW5L3M1_9SPHI|nr:RagB/SusD family nutrient uptake outer membrane protein [Sphingobacterium tabacisoli]
MRKIIILYVFFGGLFLNSCTKFLDLPPKNQRAVETLADLKSVLAGYLDAFARSNTQPIYGVMPVVTEAHQMMFEAHSDNFDFEANMSQYVNVANPGANPHAKEAFYADKLLLNDRVTIDAIWTKYYEVIGFLNALIDQSEELREADPAELKRVQGEMLVHRAYYIFKLQQYFAPMDNEELGIPLYLHTGKEVVGIKMKRKASSEIYAVITEDLKRALAYFQEVGPNAGYSRFFNERYIQNLLAQVYWFKAESSSKKAEDYIESEKYALAAIDGTEGYIPKTVVSFRNVQKNLDPEYPAVYMKSVGFGTVAPIYGSPYAAPANLKVNQDFFNSFDAGDLRKETYFVGNVHSHNWPDDTFSKTLHLHLFTPEEAYLILAESYYRNGKADLALTTLNKFKSFRGAVAKSGLSGELLLDEIIKERRKEFYCDTDKRWLDMKRYKVGAMERNLRFFNKNYNIKVEPGDYHYALPIPLSELQENPDIFPNEGWTTIVF